MADAKVNVADLHETFIDNINAVWYLIFNLSADFTYG